MKKYFKLIFIIMCIICGCTNSKISEINYTKFNNLITEKESFILYVGSDTCINCMEFKPKFEKIIKENNINNSYYIDLDKMNKDEKKSLTSIIDITGTPTVVFITNGEETSTFNRINGDVSKEKIITRLKANNYIK